MIGLWITARSEPPNSTRNVAPDPTMSTGYNLVFAIGTISIMCGVKVYVSSPILGTSITEEKKTNSVDSTRQMEPHWVLNEIHPNGGLPFWVSAAKHYGQPLTVRGNNRFNSQPLTGYIHILSTPESPPGFRNNIPDASVWAVLRRCKCVLALTLQKRCVVV